MSSNAPRQLWLNSLSSIRTPVIESANFMEDLGADSLDMVELAIKFEREFGFEISDEAKELLLTVGDAIKFLETNAFS